jgi:hypothetical protein
MSMNSVSVIKTVDGLQFPEGLIAAIMIGVDINDVSTADGFIAEVAEQFKSQRMISPPGTNALMITVVGDLSAARFAERWHALAAADAVLGIFMSQMRRADVLRGSPAGQPPETVSLLADPGR